MPGFVLVGLFALTLLMPSIVAAVAYVLCSKEPQYILVNVLGVINAIILFAGLLSYAERIGWRLEFNWPVLIVTCFYAAVIDWFVIRWLYDEQLLKFGYTFEE